MKECRYTDIYDCGDGKTNKMNYYLFNFSSRICCFFKKNILHHPLNFKSEQNFDNFVHSLFEVIHAHPYPNIPQLFYPSSDILMKKYRYDDGKIFCNFVLISEQMETVYIGWRADGRIYHLLTRGHF